MYDFSADHSLPADELYRQLNDAAVSLVKGEPDPVANMANIAALMWQFIPALNWAGFYRMIDDELVLGPFIGKPACIRIPRGQGVCGVAAASRQTQLVEDVHAFPGHIACDGDTNSELVVPVVFKDKVIAVIDLDSPDKARFTQEDAAGIEALAKHLAAHI